LTVALLQRTSAALAAVRERTRLSKTDIVNRAIALYEFIDAETRAGRELAVRGPDGDQVVRLL
jgi:hypothetical protein